MTSSSITAKNILSVLISQIPSTTETDDTDYIIIESTNLGTRIIQKKDLIASSNLNAGEGLTMEDSQTIGVDFDNIYGSGLSAANSQIYVNRGLGLSADADDRLYVNLNQLLSAGAPSSLQYWNQSGVSAIHDNPSIVKTKPLFWTKTGALSSIDLTNSGDIMTIDSSNNPVITNITNATLQKKVIVNASYGSLTAVYGAGDMAIGNGIGVWNSSSTYDSIGGVSITDNSKIVLPSGTYYIDDGFYNFFGYTYSGGTFATVDLYDNSNNYRATVGSAGVQLSGWDHWHTCTIKNCASSGTFSLSANSWYLKLNIYGQSGYTLNQPYTGAEALSARHFALYGSITVVKTI